MMIEALLARYQSPTPVTEAQYHRWDDDYAAAMRKVYAAFPMTMTSARCTPRP